MLIKCCFARGGREDMKEAKGLVFNDRGSFVLWRRYLSATGDLFSGSVKDLRVSGSSPKS